MLAVAAWHLAAGALLQSEAADACHHVVDLAAAANHHDVVVDAAAVHHSMAVGH